MNFTHNLRKVLFVSIFLSILFAANYSFAIVPGQIPSAGELGISDAVEVKSVGGVVDILSSIVKWIYVIFFVVAVLFILFAAYGYLTAQGDPEKVNKARQQIIYAAIAIAVALMALSFELIIRNFLKTGGAGGGSEVGGYNVRIQPFKNL